MHSARTENTSDLQQLPVIPARKCLASSNLFCSCMAQPRKLHDSVIAMRLVRSRGNSHPAAMRGAAPPSGRVVVLGGVSPDEGCGSSPALLMMVLVGGRDRSVAEFRELAREAGSEEQAAQRQRSGRFVIECRPTC